MKWRGLKRPTEDGEVRARCELDSDRGEGVGGGGGGQGLSQSCVFLYERPFRPNSILALTFTIKPDIR